MSLTQSQRRFLSLYEYSYLIGSEPVSEKKARRTIGARDFDQYKITAAVSCKVTEPGDYDVVMPTPTLTIFVAPMGFEVPRFAVTKPAKKAQRKKTASSKSEQEMTKSRQRRRPGDKGKLSSDGTQGRKTKRSSRKAKITADASTTVEKADMVTPTRRRIRRRHIIGADGVETTTA